MVPTSMTARGVLGILALLVAAPSCGSGAPEEGGGVGPPSAAGRMALARVPEGDPRFARIAALQAAAASPDAPAAAWEDLGRAFVQRAREDLDPGFLLQAEAASDRALELSPGSPPALVLRAVARISQHRFAEARETARAATAGDAADPAAWGALFDAAIETGDDAEAVAACERMLALGPDSASLARAGWLAWLHGDVPGALSRVASALEASRAAGGEPFAWTAALLARLRLASGDPAGALTVCDEAAARIPAHPSLLACRGRSLLALGRPEDAAPPLREALALQPLPDHAWALGDALTEAGRADEAEGAYAMVSRLGAMVDPRALAAFLAARGERSEEALALARREAATRDDPYSRDVLGWALFRAGRLEEAKVASDRALALGTREPTFLYHAGRIAEALGERAEAARLACAALPNRSGLPAAEAADLAAMLPRVARGGSCPPAAGTAGTPGTRTR